MIESIVNISAVLILLHAPNGDVISVNPESITSMRDRAPQHDADDSLMVKGVECMINLADGKSVNVTEHCDEVSQLIKGIPHD